MHRYGLMWTERGAEPPFLAELQFILFPLTPLKAFLLSVLQITLFLLRYGFHLFSELESGLFLGLGEGEASGMVSRLERVEVTAAGFVKENDSHTGIIWMR